MYPTSPPVRNLLLLFTTIKSNCVAHLANTSEIYDYLLQDCAHVNIAHTTHHMAHYVKTLLHLTITTLSPTDPRDALYRLKCWSTVVE